MNQRNCFQKSATNFLASEEKSCNGNETLSGNITLHFLLCNYLTRSNLKFVVNLDHGQGLRISYRLFK